MSASVTATSGLASAAAAASPTTINPGSLTNQNVFLQLLVAQLKNQDPENPADGTQFVTQLAQFTALQEQTQGTSDLDSILGIMQASSTTMPATPQNSTTTGTNS